MTKASRQIGLPERATGHGARARLDPIPCEGCGHLYTPRRVEQRHCSGRCRAAASRRRDEDRLTELLERLRPDDPGRPE
jgi:hypothetical protein